MHVHTHDFDVATQGRGFYELTAELRNTVAACGVSHGLASLFLRHTSASLIVCENADPDVLGDLENFMQRLVPDGDPRYRHDAEGPDDMPAHIRSVLTTNEISLPLRDGRLVLGTWQGYTCGSTGHRRTGASCCSPCAVSRFLSVRRRVPARAWMPPGARQRRPRDASSRGVA